MNMILKQEMYYALGVQHGQWFSRKGEIDIDPEIQGNNYFIYGFNWSHGLEDGISHQEQKIANNFEYEIGWIEGQSRIIYTHGVNTQEQKGFEYGWEQLAPIKNHYDHKLVGFLKGYYYALGKKDETRREVDFIYQKYYDAGFDEYGGYPTDSAESTR